MFFLLNLHHPFKNQIPITVFNLLSFYSQLSNHSSLLTFIKVFFYLSSTVTYVITPIFQRWYTIHNSFLFNPIVVYMAVSIIWEQYVIHNHFYSSPSSSFYTYTQYSPWLFTLILFQFLYSQFSILIRNGWWAVQFLDWGPTWSGKPMPSSKLGLHCLKPSPIRFHSC